MDYIIGTQNSDTSFSTMLMQDDRYDSLNVEGNYYATMGYYNDLPLKDEHKLNDDWDGYALIVYEDTGKDVEAIYGVKLDDATVNQMDLSDKWDLNKPVNKALIQPIIDDMKNSPEWDNAKHEGRSEAKKNKDDIER